MMSKVGYLAVFLTLEVTKKNPLAYCSYKNNNFANIGHNNMNNA